MPTYDYRCEKCEHVFEAFLPMSRCDEPLGEPCPECGKKKCVVKCLSTGTGVIWDPKAKKAHGMGHNSTASGEMKEIFSRIAESPGVKGTKYAQKFNDKIK